MAVRGCAGALATDNNRALQSTFTVQPFPCVNPELYFLNGSTCLEAQGPVGYKMWRLVWLNFSGLTDTFLHDHLSVVATLV